MNLNTTCFIWLFLHISIDWLHCWIISFLFFHINCKRLWVHFQFLNSALAACQLTESDSINSKIIDSLIKHLFEKLFSIFIESIELKMSLQLSSQIPATFFWLNNDVILLIFHNGSHCRARQIRSRFSSCISVLSCSIAFQIEFQMTYFKLNDLISIIFQCIAMWSYGIAFQQFQMTYLPLNLNYLTLNIAFSLQWISM